MERYVGRRLLPNSTRRTKQGPPEPAIMHETTLGRTTGAVPWECYGCKAFVALGEGHGSLSAADPRHITRGRLAELGSLPPAPSHGRVSQRPRANRGSGSRLADFSWLSPARDASICSHLRREECANIKYDPLPPGARRAWRSIHLDARVLGRELNSLCGNLRWQGRT